MINRPTCYEIGLFVEGKQVSTLAFAAQKTKTMLIKVTRQNGQALEKILTKEELELDYSISLARGLIFSPGRVAIKFTGRTERECAQRIAHAKL